MFYVYILKSKKDAIRRESFLKSGKGRKIVNKQLEN
jgi:hypothetical protein